MCLVVCPYGRLQSVLIDDESLVVGYDAIRGEPRGKMAKKSNESGTTEAKGDCIDCGRCVVVCPTGIDIRNGLQLDCVACTQCIDACDEVMEKVGRAKGLIRYDSLRGLAHEPQKKHFVMRPRLWAYAGLGVVGALVAGTFAAQRTSLAANLLRMRGAPYVVTDGKVRNTFDLHVVSKTDESAFFQMHVRASGPWQVTTSALPERLPGGGELHVVILAECKQAPCQGDGAPKVFVELRDPNGGVIRRDASLLFPEGF